MTLFSTFFFTCENCQVRLPTDMMHMYFVTGKKNEFNMEYFLSATHKKIVLPYFELNTSP